jgi:hypothetical protein
MVKVVGKHVKGCFALKNAGTGFWNTQWGPIAYGRHGHPIVVTERRYGKNGRVYRHWVRFVCNNSECHAELHVEGDFILSAAKIHVASRG